MKKMTIRIEVNLLDESISPYPTSYYRVFSNQFVSYLIYKPFKFFSKKKANVEAREDPPMDKGVDVIKSKNVISKWDKKNMN